MMNLTNVTASNCTEWWPGCEQAYFHVANVCHLTAFVVPHNFIAAALLMRLLLLIGQLMFALWSSLSICASDLTAWSIALMTINFSHAFYLTVKIFPPMIPDDLKELYEKVFKPLKVSKRQFKSLVRESEVKWLEDGEVYAIEDSTPSDKSLSILLTGKVNVTCDGAYLHNVFPNQFIDSPEWEAAEHGNHDMYFQVTVTADGRSRYLRWSRSKLKHTLSSKPFLKAIMNCLIGKDITMKLYSLNEIQSKSQAVPAQIRKKDTSPSEAPLHRSHSVDTVHVGNSGLLRSDVWLSTSQKIDPKTTKTTETSSQPSKKSKFTS